MWDTVFYNLYILHKRSDLHLATTRLSVYTLNQDRLDIISNVIRLLDVRARQSVLDHFNQDEIDTMIVYLLTD